ncbi:MAG: DUF1062 domain-containing protein [Lachnospiraceae bacterium]|nr:DUF1062 domain-containing protein [Lachnospiraceae bacterium]
MRRVTWEVQCHSLLPVWRYCKKCGETKTFICSEQFRVNAQKKLLDIWLIYRCSNCGTSWNAEVGSRISPRALDSGTLEGFYRNDKELVRKFAMDSGFLRRNGVKAGRPDYSIAGERFSPDESLLLKIKSQYPLDIKVSAVIREKLCLSRNDYWRTVEEGRIRGLPGFDLCRGRVNGGMEVVFEGQAQPF